MNFECGDLATSGVDDFVVWPDNQIQRGAIRAEQVTCPVDGGRYICRPSLGGVPDPRVGLCDEPMTNHSDGANVLFAVSRAAIRYRKTGATEEPDR